MMSARQHRLRSVRHTALGGVTHRLQPHRLSPQQLSSPLPTLASPSRAITESEICPVPQQPVATPGNTLESMTHTHFGMRHQQAQQTVFSLVFNKLANCMTPPIPPTPMRHRHGLRSPSFTMANSPVRVIRKLPFPHQLAQRDWARASCPLACLSHQGRRQSVAPEWRLGSGCEADWTAPTFYDPQTAASQKGSYISALAIFIPGCERAAVMRRCEKMQDFAPRRKDCKERKHKSIGFSAFFAHFVALRETSDYSPIISRLLRQYVAPTSSGIPRFD